ncbi:MAG TPA: hypothetical protein PKM21_00440 [Anaerolineales bacterium]|nr:hypothetical protein [Anaerolineales bacterium]
MKKHPGFALRLFVLFLLVNLACSTATVSQQPTEPPTSAPTSVPPTDIPTFTPRPTWTPPPLPTATRTPERKPTATLQDPGTSTSVPLSQNTSTVTPFDQGAVATEIPVSTQLVYASPTAPENIGIRLPFLDDFELLAGWFTGESNLYRMEFLDGGYHMVAKVTTDEAPIYSVREQYFENIRVEVDVMRADGPKGAYMGVVCRFIDTNNLYRFVLDIDGYYEISKRVEGEFTVIESGSGQGVFKTSGVNHIQADCQGPNLTLTVNGTKLLTVRDVELFAGKTGLIVGANGDPQADVLFDNFKLSLP